jgi:hypothetical protein
MKPSLYLETTIPSYLVARTSTNIVIAGRQAVTHEFWESERDKYDLNVSLYVHDECSKGDPDIEILVTTPDVEPLADEYMKLLSIPPRSRTDALHLAVCCVHGVDILLSWNFAHLGTESMLIIKKYNDVHGLHTPRMLTPDALVNKYMEVDLDG